MEVPQARADSPEDTTKYIVQRSRKPVESTRHIFSSTEKKSSSQQTLNEFKSKQQNNTIDATDVTQSYMVAV